LGGIIKKATTMNTTGTRELYEKFLST